MNQIISTIRNFNREYLNRLKIFDTNFNANFTVTETRILYELSLKQDNTLKEICEKLQIDFGYGSRIIKKYVEKGYISKKSHSKDKRAFFLNLTSNGQTVVKSINEVEDKRIEYILRDISKIEQSKFANLLQDAFNLFSPNKSSLPVIRHHKPGDMGMITHFHGKYYAENYGYSEVFEALVAKDFSEFILNFNPKKDVFFVVEQNGTIMGSLALQYRSDESAQARFFYLDNSLRGKGFGKALMNNLMDFAKSVGYKHINLWTHEGLNSAHALYKKYGFSLVETKVHSLWKENLEEQLWEKYL